MEEKQREEKEEKGSTGILNATIVVNSDTLQRTVHIPKAKEKATKEKDGKERASKNLVMSILKICHSNKPLLTIAHKTQHT